MRPMIPRFRAGTTRAARPARSGGRFAAVLLLGGCATLPTLECAGGFAPRVQDTLYFGGDTPTGTVDAEQWATFLREDVTPRFPEGLTTWSAKGQWRDPEGRIVREDTQVLALVHAGEARDLAAVDALAQVYAQRFRQQSVMRVRAQVCVAF
jgi:hypothetical protein